MIFFKTFYAFLFKDFKERSFYRFGFIMDLFNIIIGLTIFFLLSKIVEEKVSDYFSFVLIGILLQSIFQTSVSHFSITTSKYLEKGLFEYFIGSSTNPYLLIFGSSAYNYLLTFVRTAIMLVIGVVIFKAQIYVRNLWSIVPFIFISIIAFASIGMILAGIVILFRYEGILRFFIIYFFMLFSGVYYPLDVIPLSLRSISFLLPLTHALNGIREILLNNSLKKGAHSFLFLFLFAVFLLPFSYIFFNTAIKMGKKRGNLCYL